MIYFDYAATTPVDPVVLDALHWHLGNTYGNPSSAHQLGRQAREVVESARSAVATHTGYRSDEVLFTSTGSESIAIALHSFVTSYMQLHGSPGRIITTALEHKAVLEALQQLVTQGWQVEYVPVDTNGIINLTALEKLLTADCAFVTIQWVNSEIGSIQPIEAITALCQNAGVPFHSDASQAVAHVPFPSLLPDYMSFSAHKFYGPKGVSVLCVKKQQNITPLVHGGGQEFGFRSGTENVAAIAGIHVAITQLASNQQQYEASITALRDYFIQVAKQMPEVHMLTVANSVPSILVIAVGTLSAEALLMKADMAGICVSTGSACNIGSREPSKTLLAIGVTPEQSSAYIRLSLGPWNTSTEIDAFVAFLQGLA